MGRFFHPSHHLPANLHTSPRCRNRLQELNPCICRQLPFPGCSGAEAAGHSALAHRMGGGGRGGRQGRVWVWNRKNQRFGQSQKMEWNGMEWNGMEWDGMGWDGVCVCVCVDTCVFTLFSRNKNTTIWK